MDPLSNYDYQFPNYNQLGNSTYSYNVKLEQCNQPANVPNIPNIPHPYMPTYPLPYQTNDRPITEPVTQIQTELNNFPTETQEPEPENKDEEIDTKENIELLPEHRKRDTNVKTRTRKLKKKGKTSNYWNKKIEDKNFPFYGCTICDVNYTTIQELDEHVTIHKGRLTSYDIRVRNKIKRKERIKQLKKIKKLSKLTKKEKNNIKKEDQPEIEIKPEEGYIGNEKASDYNVETTQTESNGNQDKPNGENEEKDEKERKDVKSKIPEPEDPRLLKLFKCFACQKQFSLSYYLRLHVRSHTDEKPYTCATCGQSFITASKLGRHNKRIHLAIRFQCRICYRFFSRFDILTRHFDKAHPADKIEGEPYDFNAILPYLKELEEQLKEQSEAKDGKPKTDTAWGDEQKDIKVDLDTKMNVEVDTKNELNFGETAVKTDVDLFGDEVDNKDNIERSICAVTIPSSDDNVFVKEDKDELPLENVTVETVKIEVEKIEENEQNVDDHVDAADGGDSFSDEDYFPSNTWAATPAPAPAPASPAPAPPRTRRKKGEKGGDKNKKSFPMQCEFCEKVISTHSYYKIHLRTHSGERPFKCYICGRGFITSSKMHRHVLTHQEWAEGDENGEQKVKEEGEAEVKEEPDENGKTKKRRRTKKSSKSAAVKEEKDSPPRSKKYRKRAYACIYCNKRFLHQDTLTVHKKSHEGQELILKCNFCLEVMPDEESLKSHETTHSGPRPYVCTICNRTYTKKETMIYHRKSHSLEGSSNNRCSYICHVCSKSFNAQCKLQRHVVSHKVEKFILRYECPVCAHMFHTKYHVKMHLTTHQKEGLILEENRNEILAMVLQNARKIPTQPDTTAAVIDMIPQDERSRVCNICGQVFQHFYYLEEHLKSHGSLIAIEDENKAEENKHICPVCNKGFKLHYYLKLHSFTHSKERPFICQQCGKGFITKGKLKRHLETHTGLKKFQCHICYKFFTRPSYLRIHVRTIHGTQDYNFRLSSQYSNSMEQGSV